METFCFGRPQRTPQVEVIVFPPTPSVRKLVCKGWPRRGVELVGKAGIFSLQSHQSSAPDSHGRLGDVYPRVSCGFSGSFLRLWRLVGLNSSCSMPSVHDAKPRGCRLLPALDACVSIGWGAKVGWYGCMWIGSVVETQCSSQTIAARLLAMCM